MLLEISRRRLDSIKVSLMSWPMPSDECNARPEIADIGGAGTGNSNRPAQGPTASGPPRNHTTTRTVLCRCRHSPRYTATWSSDSTSATTPCFGMPSTRVGCKGCTTRCSDHGRGPQPAATRRDPCRADLEGDRDVRRHQFRCRTDGIPEPGHRHRISTGGARISQANHVVTHFAR